MAHNPKHVIGVVARAEHPLLVREPVNRSFEKSGVVVKLWDAIKIRFEMGIE